MGSKVLSRPNEGAWLDLLDHDPLVAISPEAAALIRHGLSGHGPVIDLRARRDRRNRRNRTVVPLAPLALPRRIPVVEADPGR